MTSRQKIQPVAFVDERISRYLYPFHQLLDDGAACYMIERVGSLEPKVQFYLGTKAPPMPCGFAARSRVIWISRNRMQDRRPALELGGLRELK
ncbi:MAG: hypothetical protein FJW26_17055 [Acidimicrobiia bacterium]|nr:hypothetical protein [Acidimicrobiia bacterium]